MDFNKWLSIITGAGLVGLVVLNADKAGSLADSLFKGVNSYTQTVQGR